MTVVAALRAAVAAAAFAVIGAAAQAPDPEPSPADWNAIRAVVEDQRAAIVAGDARRAFAYATPGIRARFGDARTFLAMVRGAYAPLAEARSAQPLEGVIVEGRVVQPLQLVMEDGAAITAIYTMQRQPGGHWRISGCVIAESALRST